MLDEVDAVPAIAVLGKIMKVLYRLYLVFHEEAKEFTFDGFTEVARTFFTALEFEVDGDDVVVVDGLGIGLGEEVEYGLSFGEVLEALAVDFAPVLCQPGVDGELVVGDGFASRDKSPECGDKEEVLTGVSLVFERGVVEVLVYDTGVTFYGGDSGSFTNTKIERMDNSSFFGCFCTVEFL